MRAATVALESDCFVHTTSIFEDAAPLFTPTALRLAATCRALADHTAAARRATCDDAKRRQDNALAAYGACGANGSFHLNGIAVVDGEIEATGVCCKRDHARLQCKHITSLPVELLGIGITALDVSACIAGGSGEMAPADFVNTITAAIMPLMLLTSLNLSENCLGSFSQDGNGDSPWLHLASGANAVADLIRAATSLRTLNLCRIQLQLPGVRAVVRAVQANTTLTDLHIGHNGVPEAEMRAIMARGGFATLCAVPLLADSLVGLDLTDSLVGLDLTAAAMGAEGALVLAPWLRRSTTLTWLDVSYNGISDLVLPAGWHNESDCPPYVRESDGHSQNVHPGEASGLLALAEAVRHNTSLTSMGFDGGTYTAPDTGRCPHLGEQFKVDTQMVKLRCWGTGLSGVRLLEAFLGRSHVPCKATTLDLSGCHVRDYPDSPYGAEIVRTVVRMLTAATATITELDLSDTDMTMESWTILFDGVRGSTTLEKLSVVEMFDAYTELGEGFGPPVASLLEANTRLTELDLARNLLEDAVVGAVVQGLRQNDTLASLNVLGNRISAELARTLIGVMDEKANLHTLCGFERGAVRICCEGCHGFCQGTGCALLIANEIRRSATLQTIVLKEMYCCISEIGGTVDEEYEVGGGAVHILEAISEW